MNNNVSRRSVLMAGGAALIDRSWAAGPDGDAADYPNRPVRIVMPFPAGSVSDVQLRPVAQWLSERWKQSVVVENKPGATGTIGVDAVAKAAPDGYTIGNLAPAALTILPHLTKLPFDPARDLVPVSTFNAGPIVLVANPKAPYDTVEQLVRHSKAHPGTVKVAGYGVASINHLAALLIAKSTGADIAHVPYQGGPQQVADTIGGAVPLLLDYQVVLEQHLKAGTLKAIATTGKGASAIPGIPCFADLGYPDLVVTAWSGIIAPAGTPPAIVRKLSEAFVAALAQPELRARLAPPGTVLEGSTPEAFAAFIRAEHDRWGRVIREGGVRLE